VLANLPCCGKHWLSNNLIKMLQHHKLNTDNNRVINWSTFLLGAAADKLTEVSKWVGFSAWIRRLHLACLCAEGVARRSRNCFASTLIISNIVAI
jgi:hypothetical protein